MNERDKELNRIRHTTLHRKKQKEEFEKFILKKRKIRLAQRARRQ